jgi:hypothetical protein
VGQQTAVEKHFKEINKTKKGNTMAKHGRPLGSHHRKITQRWGAWSWDGDRLLTKIQQGPEALCWSWLGARGPQGNLFGAYKNNNQQMTQANRLIYQQLKNKNCEDVQISMRCGNKWCCNINHMTAAQPNYKTGQSKVDFNIYKFTIDDDKFQSLTPEQQQAIRSLARDYSQDNGLDWEWALRWMKITEEDLVLAELKYPGILASFARSTC